ncbi:MAG: hypothetical protein RMY34_36230 [Aulosira sp. DedQUE10]|nr:hypothetical protein [Aulosira sp. DedQUE10]
MTDPIERLTLTGTADINATRNLIVWSSLDEAIIFTGTADINATRNSLKNQLVQQGKSKK